MTDVHTRVQRSHNMSKIRGKNTKPEMVVRSMLHRHGLRFRIHAAELPGRPDIVLKKFRTAIFVNGCFWHRHKGCKYATTPATNIIFWKRKFEATVLRDQRNEGLLKELGWKVLVIWECEIKKDATAAVSSLYQQIIAAEDQHP